MVREVNVKLRKNAAVVAVLGIILILGGFFFLSGFVADLLPNEVFYDQDNAFYVDFSPTYKTVSVGDSVDFTINLDSSVGAIAVTPYTYEWFINGVSVKGPLNSDSVGANRLTFFESGTFDVRCKVSFTVYAPDFPTDTINCYATVYVDQLPYQTPTPTPMPGDQVSLIVGISGSGSVVPSVGTHIYSKGSEVDLTAQETNADYVWAYWLFNDGSKVYSRSTYFFISSDTTVMAVFVPDSGVQPTPTPIPTQQPTPSPTAIPTPTPIGQTPTPNPTNPPNPRLPLEQILYAILGSLLIVAGSSCLVLSSRLNKHR